MEKHNRLENYETETCLIFSETYQLYLRKIQHIYNWLLNLNLPHAIPEYAKAYQDVMNMSEHEWNLCLLNEIKVWDRKLSNKSLKYPHYIKRSNSMAELIGGKP